MRVCLCARTLGTKIRFLLRYILFPNNKNQVFQRDYVIYKTCKYLSCPGSTVLVLFQDQTFVFIRTCLYFILINRPRLIKTRWFPNNIFVAKRRGTDDETVIRNVLKRTSFARISLRT